VLSPLPLYHSYALNLCVISIVATGASIYLMERFSTSEALRLLGSGEFTIFPAVPTIFHYLLETARSQGGVDLSSLRVCVSAGAIMPAVLNQEFESRFGVPLLDGYGITETSTMVTMNSPLSKRVDGSCGLPLVGLAVRIVDPETLRDRDPGEEGELIVRGPNVMLGYLNKPDETSKALRDGWYHTGDLARADRNGFITITGRIKELIIRGGQNIGPAEVEEVVQKLDFIIDCAVVGLPDDALGETVGLFVIPRAGRFNEAAVIEHCRQHLSPYKVPSSIHVVAEIPRTGSGKIVRYLLRELAAKTRSTQK
jgi:rifamycin polyketide synthase module 1/2/3